MRSQTRGLRLATTATMALVLVSLGGASVDAAIAVPQIGTSITIDASGSGALSLAAVSCVSAGNCTAVGTLATPSAKTYAPAVVVESAGKWGSPVSIALPAGAYAGGSLTGLTAIQCSGVGNCEAVGRFANGPSGSTTPMAASETNGVWSSASALGQPANGSSQVSAWLTGLSCTSPSSCSAVGTYYDGQSQADPMVATEVNGTWSTPSELLIASGYTPVQGLWSISCTSASCTAAGPIASGTNDLAGVASESGGTWSSASPVSTTPGTAIYGISCTTSGCIAVGDEATSSTSVPTLFTNATGTWSVTTVKAAPASASNALLRAVTCTSWGNCDVVGDVSSGTGVFALAEEHGTWTPSLSVPVSDASAPIVEVQGLSCTAALTCVAVGGVGTSGDVNAVAWTSHAPPVRRSIVCRRGRHTRRVSGVAPHCPAGFRRV